MPPPDTSPRPPPPPLPLATLHPPLLLFFSEKEKAHPSFCRKILTQEKDTVSTAKDPSFAEKGLGRPQEEVEMPEKFSSIKDCICRFCIH
jgi:hypothetical protein